MLTMYKRRIVFHFGWGGEWVNVFDTIYHIFYWRIWIKKVSADSTVIVHCFVLYIIFWPICLKRDTFKEWQTGRLIWSKQGNVGDPYHLSLESGVFLQRTEITLQPLSLTGLHGWPLTGSSLRMVWSSWTTRQGSFIHSARRDWSEDALPPLDPVWVNYERIIKNKI